MKQTRRTLSLVLAILMIAAMLCVPTFAETESTSTLPSWNNGEMPKLNNGSYDANSSGNYSTQFYADTDVFSYVFYLKNSGSGDSRKADVYHDMKPATASNGSNQWNTKKGYYTAAETITDSAISGAGCGTWSNGAYFCADYHCCPGVAFTAPYTGTVKFDFTYVLNVISNNGNNSGCSYRLVVGKENMAIKLNNGQSDSGAWCKLGTYVNAEKKYYLESNSTGNTSIKSDSVTFEVTAGEKVYFIFDSSGAGESRLWLNQVAYTSVDLPEVNVVARGLETADELNVMFLIQNSEAAAPNVDFTVNGAAIEASEPVQVTDTTGETYGKVIAEADHIYLYVVSLSAKQMTDVIGISVLDPDGNELIPEEDRTYTIEMYCQSQIAQYAANTTDAKLKNVASVCASMLLYGKNAQINFNYRTDKLPELNATVKSLIKESAGLD